MGSRCEQSPPCCLNVLAFHYTAGTSLLFPLWPAAKHIPLEQQCRLSVLTSCQYAVGNFSVWGISQLSFYTFSPVLELLTVDAHGSLVALGDAHLVSAALNLLTRVLGSVYICKKNCKLDVNSNASLFCYQTDSSAHPFYIWPPVSAPMWLALTSSEASVSCF